MADSDSDRLTASFNYQAYTYERRAAAAHLVSQLSLPPGTAPEVPDNACGTAAVTEEMLKHDPDAEIHAVDGSGGMADIAKASIESKGPEVGVESLPVLEKWMARETIVGVLEKGGFKDVKVERFDSMIGGEDEGEMVSGVSENLKGMVGGQRSEEEKAHLPEAVEQLLRGKGRILFIEKDGKKGVAMVAWIATCQE